MHLFTNWALEEWGGAVFQHLLQTVPDMKEHTGCFFLLVRPKND